MKLGMLAKKLALIFCLLETIFEHLTRLIPTKECPLELPLQINQLPPPPLPPPA